MERLINVNSISLNWVIENVNGEKITHKLNVMLAGTDCFITLFPGSGRVCGMLVDIDKYFVKKKKNSMNESGRYMKNIIYPKLWIKI